MNKLYKILMVVMLCLFVTVPVFADETGNITTETPQTVENVTGNEPQTAEEIINGVRPVNESDFIGNIINSEPASIDSLGEKCLRILYDIANWLIRTSLPISVIGFIIGIILFLWGAMSKRATVIPGVATMAASALVFIVAMNSTSILTALNNWFMGV